MPILWNLEAATRASAVVSIVLFVYLHFYLAGILVFLIFCYSEYDEEKVGLTYDEFLET